MGGGGRSPPIPPPSLTPMSSNLDDKEGETMVPRWLVGWVCLNCDCQARRLTDVVRSVNTRYFVVR